MLARSPTTEEAKGLAGFYQAQSENYAQTPDDAEKLAVVGMYRADASIDPVELAAWTQVARVLLNLNETLTRY